MKRVDDVVSACLVVGGNPDPWQRTGRDSAPKPLLRTSPDRVITLFVEFGLLAFASFLYQGGALVANLYAARYLGPAHYGILTVVYLAASYSVYLTMGVPNAMGLEVPMRRGRGQGFAEITAAAWLMTVLAALTAALIGAGYALWGTTDRTYQVALWLSIPFAAFLLAQTFVLAHLRAHKKFTLVSWQQGITGACILLGSIPLTRRFGLAGFMVAQCAAILIALALLGNQLRLPPITRGAARSIPGLMRSGLPIAVVGAVYVVLYTADRWIVLAHFGARELGQYSLATRIASMGLLMSTIIADQMYPRVAETYGQAGNAASLKPLLFRHQLMVLVLMGPAVALAYVCAPYVILHFFPTYAASVPVLKIFIVGYLPLCFSMPLGVLLNVLQRQATYLAVQCIALASLSVACIVTVRMGGGIEAVASAASVVFVLYLALLWIATRHYLRSGGAQFHA